MYVGQTTTKLNKRMKVHFNPGNKTNTRLSRAARKYCREQFYVDQIDSAKTMCELNMKEVYWISKLNTLSPNGYNLTTGGSNFTLSKESRLKISAANSGRIFSPESRKNMSDSKRGLKRSEETKLKMKQSWVGRTISEEVRVKMNAGRKGKPAHNKGKPMSENQKLKISLAKTGLYIGRHYKKKSKLKYKGVYLDKSSGKYKACIVIALNTKKNLGSFNTDIEAAIAYDRAALIYHGESRYLNFPDNKQIKPGVLQLSFNFR